MDVNFFHSALKNQVLKLLAAIVIAFCAIFLLTAFVTNKSETELFSKGANLVSDPQLVGGKKKMITLPTGRQAIF